MVTGRWTKATVSLDNFYWTTEKKNLEGNSLTIKSEAPKAKLWEKGRKEGWQARIEGRVCERRKAISKFPQKGREPPLWPSGHGPGHRVQLGLMCVLCIRQVVVS